MVTAFILCILFAVNCWAQGEEVKSGIVYYFSRYVEWPAEKQMDDFVIMIYGNHPITPHLESMAKLKTTESHQINVQPIESLADARGGHILILGKNKLSEFDQALTVTEQQNILLVTDAKGYGKKGANINFIIFDGKPSYEINQQTVANNGLKVSNNLVRLGKLVN